MASSQQQQVSRRKTIIKPPLIMSPGINIDGDNHGFREEEQQEEEEQENQMVTNEQTKTTTTGDNAMFKLYKPDRIMISDKQEERSTG